MISPRGLLTQLRTGLRNLVSEILAFLRKPSQVIRGLLAPREKEDEIPEAWLHPETEEEETPDIPSPLVAIEPSIVFEGSLKKRFKLKSPSWLMKGKRILAFMLFLGCIVSIIGLVFTFPLGLIFVIPTLIINLDYLLKTQPKTNRMRWYMLKDVEDVE